MSVFSLSVKLEESVSALTDLPTSVQGTGEYLKKLWTLLEEFAVTYGGRLIVALIILIVGFKLINFFTKKLQKCLFHAFLT